jgi:hypothetical protein
MKEPDTWQPLGGIAAALVKRLEEQRQKDKEKENNERARATA